MAEGTRQRLGQSERCGVSLHRRPASLPPVLLHLHLLFLPATPSSSTFSAVPAHLTLRRPQRTVVVVRGGGGLGSGPILALEA